MASIFGVTEHQFWRKYQTMVPAHAARRVAGKDFFQPRPLIDAIVAAELAEQKQKLAAQFGATSDSAADAIFKDASPKVLDELRRVKIDQEKITLALMRGDAIPRAELEMGLSALAGLLRRA